MSDDKHTTLVEPYSGIEQYATINDAARLHPDSCAALLPGPTEVWYQTLEWQQWGFYGCKPGRQLTLTHRKIGTVRCMDAHELYATLQWYVWSPDSEATRLIRGAGAHGISMCVGDLIVVANQRILYGEGGLEIL